MKSHATNYYAASLESMNVRDMFVSLTADQQREIIGIARGLLEGAVIPATEKFSSSFLTLPAGRGSTVPTES